MGSVKHNEELWLELVSRGIILKAQKEDLLEKEGFETTLNSFIETMKEKGYSDERIKVEMGS